MMKTRIVFAAAGLIAMAGFFMGCAPAKSYDVVVVGSGAAGLAAAIEAADAGASVALLEKMPMAGGSTLLSGGIVYATGSSAQKTLGIKDSVEDLVKYWSDRAEGKNDPAKLRFVAERSGATVDWLVSLGVKLGEPYPTGISPVRRGHATSDGGNGIVKPLLAAAEAKKVAFYMETKATKLVLKKGRVIGVLAQDKAGKKFSLNAKTVVLATGGFDRNKALMAEYAAEGTADITYVGIGSTGDGLTMAKALDAAVVGEGGVIGLRAVPGEASFTTDIGLLVWQPLLYVNKEGKRFVNESIDYPILHAELNKQTEKTSFLIFDAQTYNEAVGKAVAKGSAFEADSLDALSAAAGIEPVAFAATVAAYNKAIAKGVDAEFGKALKGQKPVSKAKFYALRVDAATIGTMVGLKTDLDSRVLSTKDKPIPGLYAAGEVANGDFFYKLYPASGTSIQMSLTFGRVAGQQAAAEAKGIK